MQRQSAMAPAVAAKHIVWLDDLDAALKQAGQAKKLVMADFSTTWCGWCKRLDAQTLSDPRVAKRAAQFVAVRIDGDKHRGLVEKYRIQGYPTILFLDATGREVHRVAGFLDPEPFLAEMQKAQTATGI